MIIDLTYPVPDIVEALLTGRVISEYNTLCAPVVCLRNSSEALLTSRVPYLNFHVFPVELNRIYLEINT